VGTGVVEVEVVEVEVEVVEVEVVVDAPSAATTIVPLEFIVNRFTSALETDDPWQHANA
jgi:hypothetical protein